MFIWYRVFVILLMNMKFCLFMVYNFSIDIIVELLINIEVCNICIFIG